MKLSTLLSENELDALTKMRAEPADNNNSVDKITLDVALLKHIIEYGKTNDLDLNNAINKMINLSQNHDYLCMDNYEEIVGEIDESKKIKGVDGKACWPGKRYAGKEKKADGTYKDICVPVKRGK